MDPKASHKKIPATAPSFWLYIGRWESGRGKEAEEEESQEEEEEEKERRRREG
jgi:hypothetical protein